MLWGQVPFALVQAYASTLRESGETVVPMVAGVCAIVTNLFLNWVLIFGRLGAPALGVRGAAIATVISRYVEMAIVLIHAHRHTRKYPYVAGLYRGFSISLPLIRRVLPTAAPLLVNEILWSLGMTMINRFYYSRGLNAVAALNINGTAWNLFCVIMFAMGTAVSIMVGQRLGAGKLEEAREVDRQLIFLTEVLHVVIGVLMILAAPYIPLLYNVGPEVRDLTRLLLIVAGLSLPIHSFAHVCYFTIRSGGKTVITFLFDSGYTWAVSVPLALLMVKALHADVVTAYATVEFGNILKCILGYFFVRSGRWIQNLTQLHA
jgi:putative MATE family efflux protein